MEKMVDSRRYPTDLLVEDKTSTKELSMDSKLFSKMNLNRIFALPK
jgi:hypothetical protein